LFNNSPFLFNESILIFNLKLRVNLEFYKSFRGIKVISPLLPFDLMSNPNGGGHCNKFKV
jgi:hypothetical protein